MKQIIEQKGMSVADLQKKSRIDRTYIYQIMDGSKNRRDSILIYAVNNRLSIMETNALLEEYQTLPLQ